MKHCQRAAWLEYNYDGVGLRPKGEAIPLATGSAIHKPVQVMLEWARDHQGEVVPREILRASLAIETQKYKKKVEERGFQEETAEGTGFVVGEQCALVEGLAWTAWRVWLPWFLGEFRVVDVEREETYVVGCTCGTGDGVGELTSIERVGGWWYGHDGRECDGVCIMSRPDFLAERLSDGELVIWDTKSSSYAPREEEFKVQFAFGTLGAERRLGRPINSYYVLSLLKGKRDFQSKDDREGGGLKKQASPLCYAWYRAGDPPFDREEWRWDFTKEKGFAKTPTWLSPIVQARGGIEALVCEEIPATKLEELVNVSPAHQRPGALINDILAEIVSEEKEWAWKTQQVTSLEDPAINTMIRRSWDCDDYYGRPCEFRGICSKYPGWEKPEKTGRWVARTPNHLAEKEGWKPEDVRKRGWVVQEEEENAD